MTDVSENKCSFCGSFLPRQLGAIEMKDGRDYYHAICPECGEYNISGTLKQEIDNNTKSPRELRLLARFARMAFQENNTPFDLNEYNTGIILQNNRLPTPKEQLDQLLKIISTKAPEVGDSWTPSPEGILVLLGIKDEKAFAILLNELENTDLIEKHSVGRRMTFKGWKYLDSLEVDGPASKRVFMAMDFNDEKFRPAVEALGLELFIMFDETRPGVIDNLMRLEIRNAQAMICDLSHANRGANWEGGYAEGLGRPVIYTCEKKVFENKHPDYEKPHFDTNHLQTIPWTHSTIDDDMKKLKASLRLAIPESIQRD